MLKFIRKISVTPNWIITAWRREAHSVDQWRNQSILTAWEQGSNIPIFQRGPRSDLMSSIEPPLCRSRIAPDIHFQQQHTFIVSSFHGFSFWRWRKWGDKKVLKCSSLPTVLKLEKQKQFVVWYETPSFLASQIHWEWDSEAVFSEEFFQAQRKLPCLSQ